MGVEQLVFWEFTWSITGDRQKCASLMAMSGCQSSGVIPSSWVVGEPPKLGVKWDFLCPDFVALFFNTLLCRGGRL